MYLGIQIVPGQQGSDGWAPCVPPAKVSPYAKNEII